MGPFSTEQVQQAAAAVTARLAQHSAQFAEALVYAGAPCVTIAHLRSPESSLETFSAAADVLAALADHPLDVRFLALFIRCLALFIRLFALLLRVLYATRTAVIRPAFMLSRPDDTTSCHATEKCVIK